MEIQISKVDSSNSFSKQSSKDYISIENDFNMCKQVKMYMSMSEHVSFKTNIQRS